MRNIYRLITCKGILFVSAIAAFIVGDVKEEPFIMAIGVTLLVLYVRLYFIEAIGRGDL